MCNLCETKPVYEFTNQRKLCRICFMRYFQKKVLYTIRRFEMIKKDDIVGYKKARGFREVVLEDVLKMFAEKTMVELIELPSKRRTDKITIASTIDLEANEIISTLIKGKVKDLEKLKPVDGKIIKPLYLFLDKEVLLYAKLKKLKFKKVKMALKSVQPHTLKGTRGLREPLTRHQGGASSSLSPSVDEDINIEGALKSVPFVDEDINTKGNKISEFIDELEKKHPEVKRAVVNSYLELG